MVADPYPNIDEFGRGACTCAGTMTGCAVCSTGDVLLRYGKKIPRLADGTPNMRALGTAMGIRHRSAEPGNRHGLSLTNGCTGGVNWCTYCAYLQLQAQGVPVRHRFLSWNEIVQNALNRLPQIVPGWYGRVPIVGEGSYSGTVPARGRSDAAFTQAHMVVFWEGRRLPSGALRDIILSDSDFGSPSRPTVPPHSIWSAATAKSFWSALGWSVCVVTRVPPSQATVIPWWGSDVPEPITATYTALAVASKLRALGITHYGKAINTVDLEAGLKKRGIDYGTSVQLIDVRALMRAGTS